MDIEVKFLSATFSPDGVFRYTLTRQWDESLPWVMLIGLNPSTADERVDDPTIRRCIGFAHSWGFGGFIMTNLFAYRATQPSDMLAAPDPIGPDNDNMLADCANRADLIVACWGVHGAHGLRDAAVKDHFKGRLNVLRLTKAGHPAHPLYLPKSLTPQPWSYA